MIATQSSGAKPVAWNQSGASSDAACPPPRCRPSLLPLLRDDRRALALHHRPYNLVSYAWGLRYQQSNQWAIETLAMAMEPGIAKRYAGHIETVTVDSVFAWWLRAGLGGLVIHRTALSPVKR